MKLSEILREDKIIVGFGSDDKTEVIKEMITLFADDERVKNIEEVEKIVLERESVMSTGVGNGFAIPHGKTNAVDEIIIGFGKTDKPINFNALDGNPVDLIFLVVGRENMVGLHIKLLSRISRMMNNVEFRKKLSEASTPAEILALITDEEKKYLT